MVLWFNLALQPKLPSECTELKQDLPVFGSLHLVWQLIYVINERSVV